MAEQTAVIPAVNQLTEFFQQFDETQAQKVIKSITYNVDSQTVIIQLRDLLRREEENLEANRPWARASVKISAAEEIRQLSSSFSDKFPELLQYFEAWIPLREDLIEECETCANKLDRNLVLASMSRIFTSTADLVGTWMRFKGSGSPWVPLALDYAPTVSFASLFLQMTLCKRMHYKIKTLVETDQELFEPIKRWFQQSRELDNAVRNFFPYGIDPELVLKINKSAANSDEYSKIFMSVIASNAKNDIRLFKDKEFLDKADMFSTSEAGVKWYRKVLLENDPVCSECFKYDIEDEIKKIMETSAKDKPEVLLDTTLLLASRVRTKVVLNGLSIFSAVSSIWNGGKSEESRILKKFTEKTKKELIAMKKVLIYLKPDGIEIDEHLL